MNNSWTAASSRPSFWPAAGGRTPLPRTAQGLSRDACRRLAVVVPQIYVALSRATSAQLRLVAAQLRESPVVWTGDGFAALERVAMK